MRSQELTEAHGEWRTGKTQLCHTLAISAQLPSADGAYTGGKVRHPACRAAVAAG